MLKKRNNVRFVEIIIGELPEGRKFSILNDGITRRKYAIGKVIMTSGKECSLIEIEREDKALSMLILKANGNIKWNMVYSRLLIGLINESGKWSNNVISDIEKQGIEINRNKHIKRVLYQKEEQIYFKI